MIPSIARNPARGLLSIPDRVEDAVSLLVQGGAEARAIGGATWIMRGHTRGVAPPQHFVALNHIAELRGIEISTERCRIGAMATHDEMARALPPAALDLRALAIAASRSANPGIRRLASLGGNLCTIDFPAADFIPALMCAGAQVGVAMPGERQLLDMADFMLLRRQPMPFIVTHVTFPRSNRLSAHTRTPARDYPVAIVSLSLSLNADGRIADMRISIGAVEADARRWSNFEIQARGHLPNPAAMGALAAALSDDFSPISTPDAPGWYRVQIMPALVRRAFEQIP